jgi:hypothetical protein
LFFVLTLTHPIQDNVDILGLPRALGDCLGQDPDKSFKCLKADGWLGKFSVFELANVKR